MNLRLVNDQNCALLFAYIETLMLKDWRTIVDKHAILYKALIVCISTTTKQKTNEVKGVGFHLHKKHFVKRNLRFANAFTIANHAWLSTLNFLIPLWIIKISDIYKITR